MLIIIMVSILVVAVILWLIFCDSGIDEHIWPPVMPRRHKWKLTSGLPADGTPPNGGEPAPK